ncbi:MAG: tRNA (adenosine(37)-N6)-threonylcarbamoyltransferase complex ATPase subunit type 1 TsaE [Marinilabiliaceae bacterium]|nr:tRNA (adenosine(37)-N6)-threonylcarbamoyltransferase complex ATPase subunit type 1 TsaE [Marinilabiliaceae bacterium]
MKRTYEYRVTSVGGLESVATSILRELGQHRIVAFDAPMGAGKTTLIGALARAIGTTAIINSPTFAIVNDYGIEGCGESIYHFDLYRLKNIGEVMDIGFDDYMNSGNFCFIEWPEVAEDILPDNIAKITIDVNPDNLERTICLTVD